MSSEYKLFNSTIQHCCSVILSTACAPPLYLSCEPAFWRSMILLLPLAHTPV